MVYKICTVCCLLYTLLVKHSDSSYFVCDDSAPSRLRSVNKNTK